MYYNSLIMLNDQVFIILIVFLTIPKHSGTEFLSHVH